jgi:CoA:oxalate CoA-transferase
MMSVTGQPGGPPTRAGTSLADITGGLFTLAGIATALYHREKTGTGTQVDVALFDGQLAILENAIARYVVTGRTPGPTGNRHPAITPFEAYATADRPLIIAAGNDALFAQLCRALGRPALAADPRFATNPDRTRHADGLKAALEEVLHTAPADHWNAVLEAAGVPCAPVHTVADAVEHPQARARNMIVTAGGLRMAGNPIKMTGFPDPPTRRPAPDLNADGDRIRAELERDETP